MHLGGLTDLEVLALSGTAVTDAGLVHIQKLKGLSTLEVTQTRVTAAGLAEFHAAVPRARITHDGGIIEPTK